MSASGDGSGWANIQLDLQRLPADPRAAPRRAAMRRAALHQPHPHAPFLSLVSLSAHIDHLEFERVGLEGVALLHRLLQLRVHNPSSADARHHLSERRAGRRKEGGRQKRRRRVRRDGVHTGLLSCRSRTPHTAPARGVRACMRAQTDRILLSGHEIRLAESREMFDIIRQRIEQPEF